MKKKKILGSIVVLGLALSLATGGVASAVNGKGAKSITKNVHGPSKPAPTEADRVAHKTMHKAMHAELIALINTTIGLDDATVKARLKAGESLATIAGANKDALIAALVAFTTKQIDGAVTAGKLTAERAATIKTNLTAHITERVSSLRGKGKMGHKGLGGSKGGHGKMGHKGGHGPMGGHGPKA